MLSVVIMINAPKLSSRHTYLLTQAFSDKPNLTRIFIYFGFSLYLWKILYYLLTYNHKIIVQFFHKILYYCLKTKNCSFLFTFIPKYAVSAYYVIPILKYCIFKITSWKGVSSLFQTYVTIAVSIAGFNWALAVSGALQSLCLVLTRILQLKRASLLPF